MWFTPQTETVIVLTLNKSLALLLSVLLAARVGAITIPKDQMSQQLKGCVE